MSNRRPNILVVMTDEHDPAIAGYAGDSVVRTPTLDAIAAHSVNFSNAICPSPICTPSRMCMMTGKEPHNCAAWANHWAIFPEHVTWPAHFARHGYRTCLVGKMHFGGRDQMQGFQERPYGDMRHGLGHQPDPLSMFPGYGMARSAGVSEIPESLNGDVVTSREALAFLLEHNDTQPDTPWFLCASHSRPHPPFTTPGRYMRRYRDRVPPPPAGSDLAPEAFARGVGEKYRDLTAAEIQRGREGYYACVEFVDACIGELLNGLRPAGLLENTLVIYTSDHGEMLGNHGMWGKTTYHDRSIGIPMLLSGPGIRRGCHNVRAPMSLIDLFPTMCGLAGIPIPKGLDGRDWSAVLAAPNEGAPAREFACSAYYRYGLAINFPAPVDESAPQQAWRAVRDERWKYVEVERGETLLFDLKSDPEEKVNVANVPAHAGVRARLKVEFDRDFDWSRIHEQLAADRQRLPQYKSGMMPSTPNQYRLRDGRVFDAERELYDARWIKIPPGCDGGIIPQQFG